MLSAIIRTILARRSNRPFLPSKLDRPSSALFYLTNSARAVHASSGNLAFHSARYNVLDFRYLAPICIVVAGLAAPNWWGPEAKRRSLLNPLYCRCIRVMVRATYCGTYGILASTRYRDTFSFLREFAVNHDDIRVYRRSFNARMMDIIFRLVVSFLNREQSFEGNRTIRIRNDCVTCSPLRNL